MPHAEYPEQPQFAVSKRKAAEALDVSIDTIKRKVSCGELEQIQIGPRRVAITMRSLLKLLPSGVNQDIQKMLEQRLGPHARQRLEIEKEAQVFGQGIGFVSIENLALSSSVLIRAVLMATGLYWRGIRNAAKVAIRHNRIESPHLPNAFDGLTIVQLSDLHVEMSEGAMERAIDLLREARYDFCILTGDYRGGTYGPYDTTPHACVMPSRARSTACSAITTRFAWCRD